jgi:alpha-1,2-mannosyltransferase
MVEPSWASCSIQSHSSFMVHHSCSTAYFTAAGATGTTSNVYEDPLYFREKGVPHKLEGFNVDPYVYGPPFLLAPKAVRAVAGDFPHFRMLWFGLTSLLLGFALLAVARWVDGDERVAVTALVPAVWTALPTLLTLQYGQAQTFTIALGVFAMIAFAREKNALGGAALAFVTLSKFFPGILLVVLAAQRRWRALGWTLGFSAVFIAATLALFGSGPLSAFLGYELPRLESGQAVRHMFIPRFAAVNHSFMGLLVKVQAFGAPPVPTTWIRASGWIYTLGVLVLAWRVARVSGERVPPIVRAQLWLVLLLLAAMRSPFLGQAYALFAPLWLLAMVSAERVRNRATAAFAIVAYVILNVMFAADAPLSTPLLTVACGIPQVVALVLVVIALVRSQATDDSAEAVGKPSEA